MNVSLADLLIYTFLGFAVLYPLFFRFVPREKIDAGFYHFNLGLSGFVGGMALVLAATASIDEMFLFGITGWLLLQLLLTFVFWNKEKIHFLSVLISPLAGTIVFIFWVKELFPDAAIASLLFISIWSHLILSGVVFAMILGHWYLNVIQLPIALLRKVNLALIFMISIRLLWNVFQLQTAILTDQFGLILSPLEFIFTLDGFFLGVALFFGLLVPFVLHIFIYKTLKLHATQSATGLLYISVLSILVGDLCFKFVMFQQGLML